VARAFKAADDAIAPPTTSESTSTTGQYWLTPPDIVMGESSSSALDLNNPHWTETRQQQLMHKMRIAPQPHTTPEETTLVEEIKNRLQRINNIHDNMRRDQEMQRQRILSIAKTGTPVATTSSLERDSDMGRSLPPNRTPHESEEVDTCSGAFGPPCVGCDLSQVCSRDLSKGV
jgi:hypothetical protein